MSRERLLAEIPAITPSALDDWERCHRLYLDRHVLRVPVSDPAAASTLGTLVHDLLRHLHVGGDCHDESRRTELLENHGLEDGDVVATMLNRHAQRCPSPAPARGHELEVVRVARGGPVWIGSGRLDAVWEHDGFLDVRDYKTGRPRDENLGDDIRAQMQLWLAAPLATGLRLRIRYEHLGGDIDPAEYEPEPEDLVAIEEHLTATVDDIRDAAARRDFPGVGDSVICGSCAYRSICPDSASIGTPTWPQPEET